MYDVTEIVPTFWLVKTLQDGFYARKLKFNLLLSLISNRPCHRLMPF